jgi:peptidoglycan-associated lipoprotein
MQPRFAALVFALGLADLAYLNLGVGPELFANASPSPSTSRSVNSLSPAVPDARTLETMPVPSASADAPRDPVPVPAASAQPAPDPAPAPEPVPPASAEPTRAPLPSEPIAGPDQPIAQRPTSSTQLEVDLTVAFPSKGSAALTPEARNELLRLAQQLRDNPHQRLRVIGHADARGTSRFNHYLGGWRARAVSQLLEAAGVAPEQVRIESRGEEDPLISGSSEDAWAANRRVEISVGEEGSQAP